MTRKNKNYIHFQKHIYIISKKIIKEIILNMWNYTFVDTS